MGSLGRGAGLAGVGPRRVSDAEGEEEPMSTRIERAPAVPAAKEEPAAAGRAPVAEAEEPGPEEFPRPVFRVGEGAELDPEC